MNNQKLFQFSSRVENFYYLGIATDVDKEKTYNFYLGTEDENDGFSIAQYNLGFICEIDELGDTTHVIYLV